MANSGMSVGTGSAGGFLVPARLLETVLQRENEANPFMGPNGATSFDTGAADSLSIPRRVDEDHTTSVSGGLTLSWIREGGKLASSTMSLSQIRLEPRQLAGLTYASEKLLRQSPQTIATLVTMGFDDELSAKLFDAFVNGDGVGKPQGVRESASCITVAKESGQAADSIVFENATKMRSRCYGYRNAFWLASHDAFPALAGMTIVSGTSGTAVYQPSLVEDRPDRLLGRPVHYTEFTPKLGDEGDVQLINPREYAICTTGAPDFAESIHLRFDYAERAFRFLFLIDAQSMWSSALTPKNGQATMSPFIQLAARA